MNYFKLEKEEYFTGEKFDNPFSNGPRIFQLHIYPDFKYDNNWVAAICDENEEINDQNKIMINKQIMQRRISSGKTNRPFIKSDEVLKILNDVIGKYDLE